MFGEDTSGAGTVCPLVDALTCLAITTTARPLAKTALVLAMNQRVEKGRPTPRWRSMATHKSAPIVGRAGEHQVKRFMETHFGALVLRHARSAWPDLVALLPDQEKTWLIEVKTGKKRRKPSAKDRERLIDTARKYRAVPAWATYVEGEGVEIQRLDTGATERESGD